jgi:hypothetical protein
MDVKSVYSETLKEKPMKKRNKDRTRHKADGAPVKIEQTATPEVQRWLPNLSSYRDQRILTFASEKDWEAAIDLLWTDALRQLPHDTPDGKALIIPADALPYFTNAGLRFTEKRLRSLGELSPEELAIVRRDRAAR